MSKYYKAEDVIRKRAEDLADTSYWEYGNPKNVDDWIEVAEMEFKDLPTIEVSEDNSIRIIENECFRDDLSQEIKDYLFSDLRHKLYHEQVEVSEDCISREKVAKRLAELWETEHPERNFDEWLKIANEWCDYFPPSVAPIAEQSSKVGEWKRHPIPESRAWDVCTACGVGCRRRHYGFNEDGTEYVEQANYPFCPNCGAKMKGADR